MPKKSTPIIPIPPAEDVVPESVYDLSTHTIQDDVAGLISDKNHIVKSTKPIKASQSDVQRQLADVYTDGDGNIPDLTQLERLQRPLGQTILSAIVIAVVVLFVVAVAGFFVFQKINGDSFTNERIILNIEPPISIISGQPATYTVTMINKEKVDLYNLELKLDYPDAFAFASADPAPKVDSDNRWDISVIKPGETKKIALVGTLIAPINSVKTMHGALSFKPANLNATFKQEKTVDIVINSSIISLNVQGPNSILAGQNATYTVAYKNTSDQPIKDLKINIDYPDGFTTSSSTPLSDENTTDTWTIAELASSTEGIITVTGKYDSLVEGGNHELKASASLPYQNDRYLQNETTFVTNVVKDQLGLQLVVNGSAEDQSISFGDLLVYSLTFKNTSQDTFTNVTLVAHLDSDILDRDTIQGDKMGKIDGSTITWTGKELPALLSLAPGQVGTITWQVRVKDSQLAITDAVKRLNVESYVEALVVKDGITTKTTSKKITHNLSSDMKLGAQVRYYDADSAPLGSGPITPKPDQTSTYNVKVDLTNNLHDVKDIRVTATLAKGVTWANNERHSTGDIAYTPGINKVSWVISRLPKTAKDTSANFNVSIKPTIDDAGKVLLLISDITLNAIDIETGAEINQSVKGLTTAFDDPTLGPVDGIVD